LCVRRKREQQAGQYCINSFMNRLLAEHYQDGSVKKKQMGEEYISHMKREIYAGCLELHAKKCDRSK
jgi:hypothetical protein